jgi:hypothetical protein
MKPRNFWLIVLFAVSPASVDSVVAKADGPPSFEEARTASWILTSELIKTLDPGDGKQWPGTRAWLKDLREQTKGIGKDIPVTKWPKVDIGALVDHNPNFWHMYYETAPGEPILTLIHAGLLLSQGEATRAEYILDLGRHRPGIPRECLKAIGAMHNTAAAALDASDTITKEGIQLFDQGDYDGAIVKYREALKLCPQNGGTYYELGYTLRTQARIARGEPLEKPGTIKTSGKLHDAPEVTAAFAESRRHDPLQYMAFQGSDPAVIQGFLVMAKKVMPAWKTIHEKEISRDTEFRSLRDLSEGFQEAGVYDLALFTRQLMAARRNSYDPSDYPIIETSLRKLAPGETTEGVLTRLRGGKGRELVSLRPLTKQEAEEGQPLLGSGSRLYIPDTPRPKVEANKPVQVDHVRLLTNEDDIAKRATVEDLGKFIKSFEKNTDEALGGYKSPCKFLVQFKCTPSGHTVKILRQPKDIDEKPLKRLYELLAKMDKLPVKEATVEFQIQLTVTPENAQPVTEK